MSCLRYDVVWRLRWMDYGFYSGPVQEKYDPYTSSCQYSCRSALNQLERIQRENNIYMD